MSDWSSQFVLLPIIVFPSNIIIHAPFRTSRFFALYRMNAQTTDTPPSCLGVFHDRPGAVCAQFWPHCVDHWQLFRIDPQFCAALCDVSLVGAHCLPRHSWHVPRHDTCACRFRHMCNHDDPHHPFGGRVTTGFVGCSKTTRRPQKFRGAAGAARRAHLGLFRGQSTFVCVAALAACCF